MICYQVFAKTPLEGVVKTRLARHVGKRHAAWVQRALLRRALMAPPPGERRLELWCAPVCAHPLFSRARSWLGWRLRRQVGRDLGERMAYALNAALRRGDSVLLMGCDLPMLSAAQLQRVERRLSVCDPVVIMPTRDGGFGVLAVHASVGRWPERALRYMRWGSALTLARRTRMHRSKPGLDAMATYSFLGIRITPTPMPSTEKTSVLRLTSIDSTSGFSANSVILLPLRRNRLTVI